MLSARADALLSARGDSLFAARADSLLAAQVDLLLSVLHLRLNTDSSTVVFSHVTIYDVQHIKFVLLSLPSLTCVGGLRRQIFQKVQHHNNMPFQIKCNHSYSLNNESHSHHPSFPLLLHSYLMAALPPVLLESKLKVAGGPRLPAVDAEHMTS